MSRMILSILLLLLLLCAGCASTNATHKLSTDVRIRGIELNDPTSNPGTAEVGCTYSKTW